MKCKLIMAAGADDNTNIRSMIDDFRGRPIEWGMLYRGSKAHKPRYPSDKWIREFIYSTHGQGVRKSIHLCGDGVLGYIYDDPKVIALTNYFDRVQLNFNAKLADKRGLIQDISKKVSRSRDDIIIQKNANNSNYLSEFPKATILLDQSGGRGLFNESWQDMGPFGDFVGYAGGINYTNIRRTMNRISDISTSDYWIDLESGARDSEDRFSLRLVRDIINLSRIDS